MSLTYKPRVSVSYERDDTNLLVSGDLGFLLSSKHQLKQIKDTEEVKNAEQVQVEKPEIISPFFNLNKTKSVQKVDTGFYDGAPFPHTHTLVIVSTNRKWSTSDLVAQGKVTLFLRGEGVVLPSIYERGVPQRFLTLTLIKHKMTPYSRER